MSDQRWAAEPTPSSTAHLVDPVDPGDPFGPFGPFGPGPHGREPLPTYLERQRRPWWDPTSATVSHLVFVDGSLVEAWMEPADGTEWEKYAAPPPPPPPPPPQPALHERVRDWLVDVCGGQGAVDALTAAPLPPCDLTEHGPSEHPGCRERVLGAAELLDDLTERFFEPEVATAYRWTLVSLWREDPLLIGRPASTAALAGGVAWAVGKANGLFNPVGTVRIGTVQDTLALPTSPSAVGHQVAAALRGFRGRPMDRWHRPAEVPDLLPLGRTDVLVSSVRDRLVRIRDRAAAAAAS